MADRDLIEKFDVSAVHLSLDAADEDSLKAKLLAEIKSRGLVRIERGVGANRESVYSSVKLIFQLEDYCDNGLDDDAVIKRLIESIMVFKITPVGDGVTTRWDIIYA